MANSKNPLADIENDVSYQDQRNYREHLKRPDRIGKIAVWTCVIFFALAAWIVTDGMMADSPLHHPWYSRLPLIGDKLWTAPAYTQLPIVGQKIHDSGMIKFIALCCGALGGFFIGKIIAFFIGNGARQDEKNKRKLSMTGE